MMRLILLGCAVLGALVTGSPAQAKRGGKSKAVPVQVVPMTPRVFEDVVEALGTVQSREAVSLTAPVTARVTAVHFTDGQVVEKGTLLVELDKAQTTAQEREIRVRLSQAQAEWKRVKRLAKADMATDSERDAQRALMQAARAELGTVGAALADRNIVAPFSGVLGLRRVSPGALVSPTTVVATLDAIDTVNLDFPVPAVNLGALKAGQTIIAHAAAWKTPFTGVVVAIASRVDPVTRSVTVRARIPNDDRRLRPGLLMTVRLKTGQTTASSLPEGALTPQGTTHRVYVVEDGLAALRPVEIGRRVPGFVEIIKGVPAGAQVIVEGVHRVRPGAPVEIIEPAPASPTSGAPR
ncbi:MAG: membrane fusion protein (multidrug efflux system) [Bradymonadia bacterium]|jgi:membrane fusion protein (multidrug efflux system)